MSMRWLGQVGMKVGQAGQSLPGGPSRTSSPNGMMRRGLLPYEGDLP